PDRFRRNPGGGAVAPKAGPGPSRRDRAAGSGGSGGRAPRRAAPRRDRRGGRRATGGPNALRRDDGQGESLRGREGGGTDPHQDSKAGWDIGSVIWGVTGERFGASGPLKRAWQFGPGGASCCGGARSA